MKWRKFIATSDTGLKRTWPGIVGMSQFDPEQTHDA